MADKPSRAPKIVAALTLLGSVLMIAAGVYLTFGTGPSLMAAGGIILIDLLRSAR